MSEQLQERPNLEARQHQAGFDIAQVSTPDFLHATAAFYQKPRVVQLRSRVSSETSLVSIGRDAEGNRSTETFGTGEDFEAALHDTLESMQSLEQVETRDIARIPMTKDASIGFTSLEHYSPKMAPTTETYPIPEAYAELFDFLDLTRNELNNGTYRRTQEKEGWQNELTDMLEEYITTDMHGRELADGLEIKSLRALTPEQAIKLSIGFVQGVSKYSNEDLNIAPGETAADKSTAMELLQQGIDSRDDPDRKGNGICRNVGLNVVLLFDALKASQGQLSMLNNTYALVKGSVGGYMYDDQRYDATTGPFNLEGDGHAWNTFITVGKNGSANVASIDATWALEKDASSAMQHMDYTLPRSARMIRQMYEKSTVKDSGMAADMTEYYDKLAQAHNHRSPDAAAERGQQAAFALTEYLNFADTALKNHNGSEPFADMPSSLQVTALKIAERLTDKEMNTLMRLKHAGALHLDQNFGRFNAISEKNRKKHR